MRKFAGILAVLSVITSIIMFVVGSTNGHLSELKDLFFVPLPLALICLLIIVSKKKENA